MGNGQTQICNQKLDWMLLVKESQLIVNSKNIIVPWNDGSLSQTNLTTLFGKSLNVIKDATLRLLLAGRNIRMNSKIMIVLLGGVN